jgi:hypothetical protein
MSDNLIFVIKVYPHTINCFHIIPTKCALRYFKHSFIQHKIYVTKLSTKDSICSNQYTVKFV